MARNDWERDWGYGGDYRQNRGWPGGWSGRDRDDRDRESRWMSQRVGWGSLGGYRGDYTGGDWEGGWNAPRHGGGGRWGQQRSWGGSWGGAEPGTRRRGWSGPSRSRENGWGWNRGTMGRSAGWRGGSTTFQRPGYGSDFHRPGYGGEYPGSSRSRRRDYGRWGGYGGERLGGRGAYYGGEYGW